MARGRGPTACHTLGLASTGEAGPDRCFLPSCPLEKWSELGPCLFTFPWGSLSVPLTTSTPSHPRCQAARLLSHPHLWLVSFPESRGSIRAEVLAGHTAHHGRQPILTGDVLHGVPGHPRAQLAAGDVGLRARTVHGEPPVALLLAGSKHPAEGGRAQVTRLL